MVAASEPGFAAIASLPDRERRDVDGRVRDLFEDIRHTLRVPTLSLLFRVSANFPDQLERLWRAVRDAVATPAFERCADELRALAVLPGSGDGPARGIPVGARVVTETAHYVLPKLLLIATAWRAGPPPGGAPVSPLEKPLPRGIAHGTASTPLVDPAVAGGELAALLGDIRAHHGHPTLASYYRALANWPDVLAALWEVIRPHVGQQGYQLRRDELVEAAERRAQILGLVGGEPPPEPLAGVLACLQARLVPELLLDVTLVRSVLDGQAAARRSPHSVR